jgi:hypothetical protein
LKRFKTKIIKRHKPTNHKRANQNSETGFPWILLYRTICTVHPRRSNAPERMRLSTHPIQPRLPTETLTPHQPLPSETLTPHHSSPLPCNTPLFVTLFKSCLVSQKWGPTKTFLSKPLEVLFLACWLGCYVIDVCLSCLLNTFVNQRNPCALVIMPLFKLLAIFQNHYLGKLSLLFKLFYLSK